jgi:hypothetical protein
MQNGPNSGFYSPSQAAQVLSLSKRRVLQLLTSDPPELAGTKDSRGRWLIARAALFDLQEHREQQERQRTGPKSETPPTLDRELVDALQDEIAHLRRESERKDTIIMSLSSANAEQARTIRAIESQNPLREGAVDEEVSREDAGMEGRSNVSDEQKQYERYARPYESTESHMSPGPTSTPPEPPAGSQTGAQAPQTGTRKPWWRRVLRS